MKPLLNLAVFLRAAANKNTCLKIFVGTFTNKEEKPINF